MKKFIHAIVLAIFSFACWLSWVVLGLSAALQHTGRALPGFTSLCISLRLVLIALPILTAIYCIGVWFRREDRMPSWIGFFAATAGVLVLTALPAMVGAYLPLLGAIESLPVK